MCSRYAASGQTDAHCPSAVPSVGTSTVAAGGALVFGDGSTVTGATVGAADVSGAAAIAAAASAARIMERPLPFGGRFRRFSHDRSAPCKLARPSRADPALEGRLGWRRRFELLAGHRALEARPLHQPLEVAAAVGLVARVEPER